MSSSASFCLLDTVHQTLVLVWVLRFWVVCFWVKLNLQLQLQSETAWAYELLQQLSSERRPSNGGRTLLLSEVSQTEPETSHQPADRGFQPSSQQAGGQSKSSAVICRCSSLEQPEGPVLLLQWRPQLGVEEGGMLWGSGTGWGRCSTRSIR